MKSFLHPTRSTPSLSADSPSHTVPPSRCSIARVSAPAIAKAYIEGKPPSGATFWRERALISHPQAANCRAGLIADRDETCRTTIPYISVVDKQAHLKRSEPDHADPTSKANHAPHSSRCH